MQCVPCDPNNNIEKVAADPKDSEISSVIVSISDQRCFLLTSVTLELDACWKHFARFVLPLESSDNTNCLELGSHINMDVQSIVASPAGSFQADQRITQWKISCSGKPLILQSSSGSNVLQESHCRQLNERNKATRDALSSFHNHSYKSSGGLSGLMWIGSDAATSAKCINGMFKVEKSAKKSSRKVRKKGKHNKRPSSLCSILHEEGIQSNSCFQSSEDVHNTATNTDTSESSGLVQKLNDDAGNEVANSSSTPTSCISFNDVTDESERSESIHQDFTAENYKWDQSRFDETSGGIINSSSIIQADANLTKAVEPSLKHRNSGYYISSGNDVLDSFSDGWNSDATYNGSVSGDASLLLKEQVGNDSLDSGITSDYSAYSTSLDSSIATNQYFTRKTSGSSPKELSCGDWSMIIGSTTCTDKARAGNQECSNINTCSTASAKRRTKKLLGSARKVGNQSACVNVHGHTGKENNQSVWQRVPKNGEFTHKAMCKSSVVVKDQVPLSMGCDAFVDQTRSDVDKSGLDEMPAEQDGREGNLDLVNCSSSSIKADGEPLKINVSKFKKISGFSGKQEHKSNSRKGHNGCKINSSRSARKISKQKESFESFDLSAAVSSPENVDGSSVMRNSATSYLEDKKPPGDVHNVNPITDSVDKKAVPGLKSDCSSHLSQDNECHGSAGLGPEDQHSECSKQASNPCSFLQKWVPVGRKDYVVTNRSNADTMVTSHMSQPASDSLLVKDQDKESLSTPVALGVAHVNPNTPPICKFYTDQGGGETGALRNQSSSHLSPCSLSTALKDQEVQTQFDTEKILQVVDDAYQIQTECERIQSEIGGPLAEFERVLYSASPIISDIPSRRHCSTCSAVQVAGNSLCRNQMPNICLSSLWEWYERQGSYGLEVKAIDFRNSKRLGGHHFEFCAYFVPFLSAVQLFGNKKSGIKDAKVAECCAFDTTEEDSPKSSFLPILSMLLPQPCKENEPRSEPSFSGFCDSDSSPACRSGALVSESELLFEYFEFEQPQQRQPLYEKIKELVKGEATSNLRMFGDPKTLESLHLHDLHPSSWYSVAWYPIYRIPDANFRAAFLTYHSLGHFIHRDTPTCFNEDTGVVNPVVGLQSYNAQGECWFRTMNSSGNSAADRTDSAVSSALKQRLSTLEQTASVMARAAVCKGNQKSVNRQPDYEFFLSRRR
ncbi:hypothetical protein H6P81_017797 [Aristolochia fimbriata]|uniref:Uncharacterized protein n=1 Tax=Aristolochia fimbriata TaxID=158543 RepID=A0AAV7DZY1_ARIFI|nr:hypothetical protein H6P81_017797 [Aristolochia fimbriata]